MFNYNVHPPPTNMEYGQCASHYTCTQKKCVLIQSILIQYTHHYFMQLYELLLDNHRTVHSFIFWRSKNLLLSAQYHG